MKHSNPQSQAPFRENGDMDSYDNYRSEMKPVPTTQYLSLNFDGFERGRSAARAIFKESLSGREFPMFLTDLGDLLAGDIHVSRGVVDWPHLEGDFIVVKRGSNYGLRALDKNSEHAPT